MDGMMDRVNRLSLPAVILIASVILGGFYYASQVSKQRSIERQQQIELQAKTEQENRDYTAKRKTECLAIYKTESDKFNNVQNWSYIEPTTSSGNMFSLNGDTCEIIYKDDKTGETFSRYY